MNTKPIDRLRQIYESTIESGISYSGNLEDIDFYSLLCKSTSNNQLYKIFSCNLYMYNYEFENEDSILMIFSIPVSLNNDNQQENRHVSERVMEILKLVEECFSTVDYMKVKNVKEDKFIYMTVIKKIKEDN